VAPPISILGILFGNFVLPGSVGGAGAASELWGRLRQHPDRTAWTGKAALAIRTTIPARAKPRATPDRSRPTATPRRRRTNRRRRPPPPRRAADPPPRRPSCRVQAANTPKQKIALHTRCRVNPCAHDSHAREAGRRHHTDAGPTSTSSCRVAWPTARLTKPQHCPQPRCFDPVVAKPTPSLRPRAGARRRRIPKRNRPSRRTRIRRAARRPPANG
jgi:hypothetical protein